MIAYESDYFMHHGVKGMKWGRRKQRISKGVGRVFSKYAPTKQNIQRVAKARAYDREGNLKSTGRIVAGSIGRAFAIGFGGGVAQQALHTCGHKTLGNVVGLAANGAGIAETVIGVTSAVQRGRGRYGK